MSYGHRKQGLGVSRQECLSSTLLWGHSAGGEEPGVALGDLRSGGRGCSVQNYFTDHVSLTCFCFLIAFTYTLIVRVYIYFTLDAFNASLGCTYL